MSAACKLGLGLLGAEAARPEGLEARPVAVAVVQVAMADCRLLLHRRRCNKWSRSHTVHILHTHTTHMLHCSCNTHCTSLYSLRLAIRMRTSCMTFRAHGHAKRRRQRKARAQLARRATGSTLMAVLRMNSVTRRTLPDFCGLCDCFSRHWTPRKKSDLLAEPRVK